MITDELGVDEIECKVPSEKTRYSPRAGGLETQLVIKLPAILHKDTAKLLAKSNYII